MDTNMEDVGRVPAEVSSMPTLEPATVPTVDGWIESLMNCKQLAESDVQRLCEKVRPHPYGVASGQRCRLGQFSWAIPAVQLPVACLA
jgi:hypothetical protein